MHLNLIQFLDEINFHFLSLRQHAVALGCNIL
jgi:hypothetical protein